jgi:hypothetical protein
VVEILVNSGNEPTILLLSQQYISELWENDINFRTSMVFQERKRYLSFSGINLQVIEIHDKSHVYVLNKKAGRWLQVALVDTDIRLDIEKPLSVQITEREMVEYQVIAPDAIAIISPKAISDKQLDAL